jgi:hypothetical protein
VCSEIVLSVIQTGQRQHMQRLAAFAAHGNTDGKQNHRQFSLTGW